VCCAGSRLLVQESIAERFLGKVKARMQLLRLGSPLDKSMDMGTLIDPTQLQRVTSLVESARAEGCDIWQPPGSVPDQGNWYPPTLITGASTSAAVAQTEIFGPVLVAMSFRTPTEAVQLANNTVYGLACSIWSESISLALDVAPQIKAGVVWINTANQFDAACGFGGYRESGFGREGGREGMLEYLTPRSEDARPDLPARTVAPTAISAPVPSSTPAIDRTAKLYIGGKQTRPDSAYSRAIHCPAGVWLADVGEGNRKDIRNAVEAAHQASGWARASAHNRAQVLYYIAENLAVRSSEFAQRIAAMTGAANAQAEVEASIERLFYYAAWADKYDGVVHQPPMHGITVALHEPLGVIGIVCPNEAPLLGLISLIAPAIALGNRVVVVPSEAHPLSAIDLYQVLDTSDLPGGVVNIVTGNADALAQTLASHSDVDALWRHDGSAPGCAEVERLSAQSLKRTWVSGSRGRDWFDTRQSAGTTVLAHASQVKNIWIPYGV
jgi:aldehyde dehydrogenase (NAD+)